MFGAKPGGGELLHTSPSGPPQPASVGLSRLARACWIPTAQADDLAARCAAALETSAEYTIVVSTTAARLHGFWLPDLPDVIHLATAAPGSREQFDDSNETLGVPCPPPGKCQTRT